MCASESPVVSEQPLPVTDQQLYGEELRTDIVENKWSSRKTVLFVMSASLILWPGVILVSSQVF